MSNAKKLWSSSLMQKRLTSFSKHSLNFLLKEIALLLESLFCENKFSAVSPSFLISKTDLMNSGKTEDSSETF